MEVRRSNPIFYWFANWFKYMILDNLYLFLDLFSVSFPLLRSFDKRLLYYKKWHALFPAIFFVGFIYVVWDILFTKVEVWGFNPRYLTGLDIVNLPIEEWLFFLFIPFACIFIYEATLYYIKKRPLKSITKPMTIILGVALVITGLFSYEKLYTCLTFISTGGFLLFHAFFIKRDYLDRFYIGYLFSLIPFLLVNGVLTGSFIEDQIVWYNDEENLGLRIFTIPIEDSIYLLLYLLSITTIYEQILKRFPVLKKSNSILN